MKPSRLLWILPFVLATSCANTSDFDSYVTESLDQLDASQERLRAQWKLGTYEHFDWDQTTGILTFSSGGEAKVLADFQFTGTISKTSHTWLWAWANPTDLAPLRRDVEKVKKFGQERGFDKLVEKKWPADEADGWAMTAIAARVLKADGAYRTEGEKIFSYMVLKNVRKAPPGYQPSHEGDR